MKVYLKEVFVMNQADGAIWLDPSYDDWLTLYKREVKLNKGHSSSSLGGRYISGKGHVVVAIGDIEHDWMLSDLPGGRKSVTIESGSFFIKKTGDVFEITLFNEDEKRDPVKTFVRHGNSEKLIFKSGGGSAMW